MLTTNTTSSTTSTPALLGIPQKETKARPKQSEPQKPQTGTESLLASLRARGVDVDRLGAKTKDQIRQRGAVIDKVADGDIKTIGDLKKLTAGDDGLQISGVKDLKDDKDQRLRGMATTDGKILLDTNLEKKPAELKTTAIEEIGERTFQDIAKTQTNDNKRLPTATKEGLSQGDFGAEVAKRVTTGGTENDFKKLRSNNQNDTTNINGKTAEAASIQDLKKRVGDQTKQNKTGQARTLALSSAQSAADRLNDAIGASSNFDVQNDNVQVFAQQMFRNLNTFSKRMYVVRQTLGNKLTSAEQRQITTITKTAHNNVKRMSEMMMSAAQQTTKNFILNTEVVDKQINWIIAFAIGFANIAVASTIKSPITASDSVSIMSAFASGSLASANNLPFSSVKVPSLDDGIGVSENELKQLFTTPFYMSKTMDWLSRIGMNSEKNHLTGMLNGVKDSSQRVQNELLSTRLIHGMIDNNIFKDKHFSTKGKAERYNITDNLKTSFGKLGWSFQTVGQYKISVRFNTSHINPKSSHLSKPPRMKMWNRDQNDMLTYSDTLDSSRDGHVIFFTRTVKRNMGQVKTTAREWADKIFGPNK